MIMRGTPSAFKSGLAKNTMIATNARGHAHGDQVIAIAGHPGGEAGVAIGVEAVVLRFIGVAALIEQRFDGGAQRFQRRVGKVGRDALQGSAEAGELFIHHGGKSVHFLRRHEAGHVHFGLFFLEHHLVLGHIHVHGGFRVGGSVLEDLFLGGVLGRGLRQHHLGIGGLVLVGLLAQGALRREHIFHRGNEGGSVHRIKIDLNGHVGHALHGGGLRRGYGFLDLGQSAASGAGRFAGGLDFSFDEGFLGAFAGRGQKRGETHVAEHLLARGAGAVDDAEDAAGNEHDRRRQEGDKGDPLRFGMAIHARLRLPS